MAIPPYTGESILFVAGDTAPPPDEALLFGGVINAAGEVALECFKVNPLIEGSIVELQASVLCLRKALTTLASGKIDSATGEFVRDHGNLTGARRVVSGDYTGPGSRLIVT